MISVTHNWDLKILAVLAAVVLWFYVVGIENAVHVFPEQIAVKTVNLDKNIGLASELSDVKLYLKVSESILPNINANNFDAYVDLADLKQGEYDLPVQVKSDNPQIIVLKVNPEKIHVKLASIAEKEVPVVVSSSGGPKEGYVLKEIKLETEKVKISAAQNLLDRMDSVKAEVLLDGTETGDIKKNVSLAIGSGGTFPNESVTISPDQVVADVIIQPESLTKTVKIEPQVSGTGDTRELLASLVTSPETIEIQGESRALQDLTGVKTEIINVKDLLKRTVPLGVKLILPDGVKLVKEDQEVTVMVSDKEAMKVITAPVVVTRESGDFKVKDISPAEIALTLIGPAKAIETLGKDNVSVNLNLQGISSAGKMPVNIKDIIVPDGIGIIDFEPSEITITAV
jgi:YbbR domain-containing protein